MACCNASCSAGHALQQSKVWSCAGGRAKRQRGEARKCILWTPAVPTSEGLPLALAHAGWAAECALTVAAELAEVLAGLALPAQGHCQQSVVCLRHIQKSSTCAQVDA